MAHAALSRPGAGRMPVRPPRQRGQWKLAYADFLTALAALFLLMWLTSGMTPGARVEIARYFRGQPPGKAVNTAAVLTLNREGASAAETERLYAALVLDPDLKAAGDSLQLTRTPDGLRIDLVEDTARPLFASGKSKFTDTGAALAKAVAKVLAVSSRDLSLEGHTDAFAGATNPNGNWSLSSGRALEAREILVSSGVEPGRIRAVTGYADTRPFAPGEPHRATNRRVSILVHLNE